MTIQIQMRILPQVLQYTYWEIIIFFYFYQCQFTMFCLSRPRHRCHNFHYFEQYIEISGITFG
jgi:hypothetical protein